MNGNLQFHIERADLSRDDHRHAVLAMIDAYASDPLGQGRPLEADVRDRLIEGLRAHPTTIILLAFGATEPNQIEQPIGAAVCFLGFSTFAARPLINIHDLTVLPSYRGLGVGRRLLDAVAHEGDLLGCCKVTLEVLEGNAPAKGLYEAWGFQEASAQDAGRTLFMTKVLSPLCENSAFP